MVFCLIKTGMLNIASEKGNIIKSCEKSGLDHKLYWSNVIKKKRISQDYR